MNFSYVLSGILAGMALPGRNGDILDDISFIKKQGIGAVLTLTEDPLPLSAAKQFDMQYLHIPIRDFTAPRLDQVEQSVAFIQKNSERKIATAVHCYAGVGRTGTIIACYLVSCGYSAIEAIKKVRELRPGSIQGSDQENCIFRYERVK